MFHGGGQYERRAQILLVFVYRKARPVGRQFEEDATRLSEVDRFEPESVDLRCGLEADSLDEVAQLFLLISVARPPGEVGEHGGVGVL